MYVDSANKVVFIGIPTYNRKSLIKMMGKSLYNSDLTSVAQIVVYDDCSSEYDESDLKIIFPTAKIVRHENNLGADGNMWYMYKDSLNYDYDYFINADSDLIFRKDWVDKCLCFIKNTQGCMSLFNTEKNHTTLVKGEDLLIKDSLGAAGMMFTRDIIEDIINHFSECQVHSFDWQWSEYLRIKGLKLYVVRESLVQHIGFAGQNGGILGFDYGENFVVDSITNGQAINDAVEKYYKLLNKENFIKNSIDYRLGNRILSPLRRIKKLLS